MDFDDYQLKAEETFQFEKGADESKIISLLGLAGEIGELATEYKKKIRDGRSYKLFAEKLEEEIGDILWYLASIATQENISLNEVASKSICKTTDRWKDIDKLNKQGEPINQFDLDVPESQRLPRSFVVGFVEKKYQDGKRYVDVTIDGQNFGDKLRDNAYIADYYRFHDVFHFSYAVVLGWSPVIRKLLNCKRSSTEQVDEVEDGGRAAVIDEAISALVFEYARDVDFFHATQGVDYSLLRTIKDLTRFLEVNRCTAKQWETAILLGFDMWRKLRNHKRGYIHCNLDKRSMVFEEFKLV